MTKTMRIKGMYYNDMLHEKEIKDFTVRVTKGGIGSSLSITDEERGIMLHVPLDQILGIIGISDRCS